MKTQPVNNLQFCGKVIGCSWLKPKQRRMFKQVRPCLENLVKNKNYDLKISYPWGRELRVSIYKNSEYSVINSNTPAEWINRAKEIIRAYEENENRLALPRV